MAAWTYQPVEPARAVPAPSGWEQAVQFDPFEAFMGPYFVRFPDGQREMGFFVDDRHTNVSGYAHGGALMTFSDAVLGFKVWDETDRAPCVTISQQTNFVGSGRLGDFVVCRPVLVRRTREIVFV
ncbi:MAG TPA: PaaI family thioesterase, partial [Alphaproteobacteria bacterium]|nr:PaaI family thioesterase [Alphaproteobacteria bacterium]